MNSVKNCDAIGLNGMTIGVKLRLQRSKSTSLLLYTDIFYIAINFIHYPNDIYKCNFAWNIVRKMAIHYPYYIHYLLEFKLALLLDLGVCAACLRTFFKVT